MPKAGRIIAGVAAAAATTGIAAVAAKKLMAPKSVFHVSSDGDGWAVTSEGGGRAVSRHGTKKEAVAAARELAHGESPSRLVIHRSDGSVQRSHDYRPA